MIKRNIYISIGIIGLFFTFLAILFNTVEVALTIVYFTLTVMLTLKFLEEYRHYNSYNVPPASAIFILIPALLAVFGSILAPHASLWEPLIDLLQTSIITFNLNIDFIGTSHFLIFLNFFSVIFVLPFFIILLYLLKKYYSGRYPVIFILRKRYSREIIIWFNLLIDAVLFLNWIVGSVVDLGGLLFVIISAIFIFHYIIINHITFPTGGFSNYFRKRFRNKNSSITIRPSLKTRNQFTEQERNINPRLLAKLVPTGHILTMDDFRCIFCYNFPIESNIRVVVCPYCGHSAHSHELEKWLTVSNLCSRCNRPISRKKMIRVSGNNYKRVIQLFKANQLRSNWSK